MDHMNKIVLAIAIIISLRSQVMASHDMNATCRNCGSRFSLDKLTIYASRGVSASMVIYEHLKVLILLFFDYTLLVLDVVLYVCSLRHIKRSVIYISYMPVYFFNL